MVSIGQAYWHYDMSYTYIGKPAKRFLNPELLKFYLTATFLFLLKLYSFLGLVFYCRSRTSMLKLYLGAKRPTLAKVISKIYHGMWYVEASMTWIVAEL